MTIRMQTGGVRGDMTFARVLVFFGAAALAGAISWALGADGRPLGAVLSGMISEPWTVVTLVDLYLGFFLLAIVIFLAERNFWAALFWATPMVVLGNLWPALWLIVRAPVLARRLRN